MRDIQSLSDDREVSIDQVGVCDLRIPIFVLDRAQERQRTVAKIAMSVSLQPEFKGTHMSRFIEVLNEHAGEMTLRTLPKILADLRKRLDAKRARIEIAFPYFLRQEAPVTKAAALVDYDCNFVGEASETASDFVVGVRVPVTTVCPCSKAISDFGAHNQRGTVTIEVRAVETAGRQVPIWIEELIEIAERSASAPVRALVKRPDERHLTMQAYENPVFVEDVVRNAAVVLKADARVCWFRLEAKNDESIHNHNAFARIEWTRPS